MHTLRLAACWMLVALPLSWGVYRSVQKSLPLFGLGPGTPKKGSPATPAAKP
jgi:hypothetical protein